MSTIRNRTVRIVGITMSAALLAAGCGRAADSGPGKDAPANLSAGKAKGTVVMWSMGDTDAALQDLARKFKVNAVSINSTNREDWTLVEHDLAAGLVDQAREPNILDLASRVADRMRAPQETSQDRAALGGRDQHGADLAPGT